MDFLKSKGIPLAIATNSGLENIDFFYVHFQLHRWFNKRYIIFNDGSVPGKPSPDLFLKAADLLSLNLSDLIIFEDSGSGILAAERAKAGKIIIINSNKVSSNKWKHEMIDTFHEIETDLFT